jgi:hypothetical protein
MSLISSEFKERLEALESNIERNIKLIDELYEWYQRARQAPISEVQVLDSASAPVRASVHRIIETSTEEKFIKFFIVVVAYLVCEIVKKYFFN